MLQFVSDNKIGAAGSAFIFQCSLWNVEYYLNFPNANADKSA